jgi:hypothetical protein
MISTHLSYLPAYLPNYIRVVAFGIIVSRSHVTYRTKLREPTILRLGRDNHSPGRWESTQRNIGPYPRALPYYL